MEQCSENNIDNEDNKSEDHSLNSFYPLCAQPLDYNPEIYKSALDFALGDDDVKNIAISGAYCSGKSTIWNTYLNLKEGFAKRDDVIITVQLGKYIDYYSNSSLVNQQNKQNTSGENEIENRVERQIINQILAQVKPNKIPLYEHKYKQNKKCSSFWSILLFGILLLICLVFWDDKEKILVSRLSLVIMLMCTIGHLMRKDLIRISKITFKGAEATVSSQNNDETVLDRENKELVYLLNSSKAEIVVFEDLDRFENINIFNKLKELNFLLNSYRKINGNSKPVKFIYMIKDSVFISENRVKFFDFIIPVIPIINEHNSIDYLYEEMSKSEINIKSFDEKLLINLALYLNDMRVLKNILNEFIVYKNCLNYDDLELSDNKILTLMVLKNLFPKEYELLCAGQGLIYNILDDPQGLKEKINILRQKYNQKPVDDNNNGLMELFRVISLDEFKSCYRRDIAKTESDLKESFVGLIYYLVKSGYLDKTYYYYIGNFRTGQDTIGRNDRIFIKNLLEQNTILIGLEIENPHKINIILDNADFHNKYIFNCILLKYLVEKYNFTNDLYANRIRLMFDVLVEFEEETQSSLMIKLVHGLKDELLKKLIVLIANDESSLVKLLEYCPEKSNEIYLKILLIFLSTNEIIFPTSDFRKLAEYLDGNLGLISGLDKTSFDIFLKNIINFNARYNLYADVISNRDILDKMVNAGVYIKDVNNLCFIIQYFSKKKLSIADLIHEIYINSRFTDIWNKTIEENPEFLFQYVDGIPETTKINLGDGVFQKILNSSSHSTELKNKFIECSDSKILNLEDIQYTPDFNNIISTLINYNLIEINKINLQIIWKNDSISQEDFIKYLENNSSNPILREVLSQSADICNMLIQWNCNNDIFNIASEITNVEIKKLSKVITRARIKTLISKHLVELNYENIDFLIQQNYNQELYLLSKNRENEFIDIIIGYNLKISYEQIFFIADKISKENLIKLVNDVEGYESTAFNINNRKIKYILSLDEIILSFRIGILEKILEKQVNIQSIVEYLKAFPEAGQLTSVFNGRHPILDSSPKIEIAKIFERYGYITIRHNRAYMIKRKTIINIENRR